eukprot:1136791-Pelagomonas_calceolata.AAC.14
MTPNPLAKGRRNNRGGQANHPPQTARTQAACHKDATGYAGHCAFVLLQWSCFCSAGAAYTRSLPFAKYIRREPRMKYKPLVALLSSNQPEGAMHKGRPYLLVQCHKASTRPRGC